MDFLLYQDSANCNGGKWIIRFKKAISGRFWEDLVSEDSSILVDDFVLIFSLSFSFLLSYSDVILGKTYS